MRITLLAFGLNPGVGVLHADLKARDALALDLMEVVRPRVDAYVLDLLRTHTFAARDFFETRQGVCRVLPPLTHPLSETAPVWAKAVAPVAEAVLRAIFRPEGRTPQRDRTMPTVLTGANRSAGREATRRRPWQWVAAVASDLPPACKTCGAALDEPKRAYCNGCLPERRAASLAIFATAGPEALAELRAAGADSAYGGNAGRKRRRRNAELVRAIAEWERSGGGSGAEIDFARDVLPRLQGAPLSELMQATELSVRFCSLIRRGLKVPHPRQWAALARLGGQNCQ